jgi:hypothetical protein
VRLARAVPALVTLACAGALATAYARAPGFPDSGRPAARVDAALIEKLRAHPGLHVPLAQGYAIDVPLDLRDDPVNRFLFRTEVDAREPVPALSIHIQKKGARAAIHADRFNPLAGIGGWVLHNSVDTQVVPLALGGLMGLVLAARGRRRRG